MVITHHDISQIIFTKVITFLVHSNSLCLIEFFSVQEVQEEGKYAIDSPGNPAMADVPPEEYTLGKCSIYSLELKNTFCLLTCMFQYFRGKRGTYYGGTQVLFRS